MPYVFTAIVLAIAGAAGWLARPLALDPKHRTALADAVSELDREIAANLELMTMFDQTKQAVVLENGEFERHRETIESYASAVAPAVADLYARIPETEAAMERRGPANSVRDEDRRTIEAWEGDARAAQRQLRGARDAKPLSGWRAAMARLRGSRAPG